MGSYLVLQLPILYGSHTRILRCILPVHVMKTFLGIVLAIVLLTPVLMLIALFIATVLTVDSAFAP